METRHEWRTSVTATGKGRALVVGVTGIVGQAVARRTDHRRLGDVRAVPQRRRVPSTASRRCRPTSPTRPAWPPRWTASAPSWSPSPPGPARTPRRRTSPSTAAPCATCSPPLEPARSVRHVALMTGLKHYLGPFEAYATGDDGRHPVPRGGAAAGRRRTSTTRRRTSCSRPPSADGFTLERAPRAHGLRLRHRQRDEHGR